MEMGIVKERKGFDSFNFGLFMLAIGLFITNTRILYHLNPDATESLFSYRTLNENSIISMIIASVYSITTISIISKLRKMNCYWYMVLIMIIPFALIDGYGVHLYYNTKMPNFIIFAAVYYGIYTSMILVFPAMEKMIIEKFTKKKEIVTPENENILINNLQIEISNLKDQISKQSETIKIQKVTIETNKTLLEKFENNYQKQRELFIQFFQVDKLLINEKKGRNENNRVTAEKLEVIKNDLKNQLNLNGEIDNLNKEVLLPKFIPDYEN